MANKMVFINLPVKDLKVSRNFYTSLGYTINENFSDETAACVVISETIYVMILTHPKFKEFCTNEIADAKKTNEVLLCLSCDSKDEVASYLSKAVKAGGKKFREGQDLGFMISEAIQDPDGHVWEYMYMDMSQVPQS